MIFTFFPILAAKKCTMEENNPDKIVSWGSALIGVAKDKLDEAKDEAVASVIPLAGEE